MVLRILRRCISLLRERLQKRRLASRFITKEATKVAESSFQFSPSRSHIRLIENIHPKCSYQGGDVKHWQREAKLKLWELLGRIVPAKPITEHLLWTAEDATAYYKKIIIETNTGDWMPVYRCQPKKRREPDKWVICLQGHTSGMHVSLALDQESETKKIETKKIVHEVNIPNKITIKELSNRMAMQASEVIKNLLGMGVVATINHTLDADTAEYLVKEFGNIPIRDQKPDLNIQKLDKKENKNLKTRSPIVTVMGHVDHGKTSLLDALRKTNVVADEHGGITQHIGAYKIITEQGKSITFIDTPGHAAFTEMRARGSKVTDIVVLVVAADDGVKPQTIEAINHSKAAKVPIIVAINKCDLPGADPQKIKNELLQYELIAEELSGDTLFAEVSATTKKNLDKLKENISLQADLLDLKADFSTNASGVILESRIDKGKGPVSTVLITNGSLKNGNFFVSGNTWGKIRAMINDEGQKIDLAEPSTPVEILGMNGSAFAGDDFVVVETEEKAKEIHDYRIQHNESKQTPLISTKKESAFNDGPTVKELPVIIKSDVHGSSEALKSSIEKIKHEEVTPKIILANIGVITETDITLAKASNAIVIGFNVRPNKEAKKLAEIYKITIKYFNIIYEVLDYINNSLSGLLTPSVKEEIVGSAQVQAIFKVSKIGKVAGSKVIEGEIINNLKARLIRDGNVLYTGSIGSIFREKNAAKQVAAGLECGITLKDFADYKEKDVIEVYRIIETERRI